VSLADARDTERLAVAREMALRCAGRYVERLEEALSECRLRGRWMGMLTEEIKRARRTLANDGWRGFIHGGSRSRALAENIAGVCRESGGTLRDWPDALGAADEAAAMFWELS